MDLPWIPSCRLTICTTREGDRVVVEPGTGRLRTLVGGYPRAVGGNGRWLLPADEETRAFLLALPGALPEAPMTPPFRYVLRNGSLCREGADGRVTPETFLSVNMRERLSALVELRDMSRRLFSADLRGEDATELRGRCAAARDAFVRRFGVIGEPTHFRHMDTDPEVGLLLALGPGSESGRILRGPLFFSRAPDARSRFLARCPLPLREDAARILGVDNDEAERTLRGWGFLPDAGGRFRPAVELGGTLPPSSFDELYLRPGLPWIGEDIHQKWLDSRFPGCSVRFVPEIGRWQLSLTKEALTSTMDGLGTEDAGFGRILRNMMSCAPTLIRRDGMTDEPAIREAGLARERICAAFREDLARLGLADEIVRRHDAVFPREESPRFDGDALAVLPGCTMSPGALYPHQREALRRLLTSRSVFLAHEVGAGKTLTQVVAAMEWRRLRLARRSILTVPSGMVEQTRREIYSLYPFARVLLLTPGMVRPYNAGALSATVKHFNPDIILMSHEAFVRLEAPEDARLQEERRERLLREAADGAGLVGTTAAAFEKWRDGWREEREEGLSISCLDADAVIVDEAHMYKSADTRRGKSLLEISLWLQNSGGRIVLASGTPLSNRPEEIYQMQRYLQEGELRRAGIWNLATWRLTFLEMERTVMPSPDGMGYAFRAYLKIADRDGLLSLFGKARDQVRLKDCEYIARPALEEITKVCPSSAAQRKYLRGLALDIAAGANPLPLLGQGRLASLCPSLVGLPEVKTGKMAQAAKEAARLLRENPGSGGLVFIDLGVPRPGNDGGAYAVFTEMLAMEGVGRERVGWVQDASSRLAREELFRRYRDGELSILIGSTQTLGEGANVQNGRNGVAFIFHMNPPWRPKDNEQRNGRGVRQGNRFDRVLVYYWVTTGSLDEFMRATINRKSNAFVSCFQETNLLECCGDRSGEIARCRTLLFWPDRLDAFDMSGEETREWRKRLDAALHCVEKLKDEAFHAGDKRVFPPRSWPALVITETKQIKLNGKKVVVENEEAVGVPLYVLASAMLDREGTLRCLREARDALTDFGELDFSFVNRRREDARKMEENLTAALPVNVRQRAMRMEETNDLSRFGM